MAHHENVIPTSANSCPAPMSRAALIALRNAGQLRTECPYIINDHVQNRLVAGTTITMHAVDARTLSENVSVKTTYDNEAWRGIYDLDRGLVLELQDNRGNIARGFNGLEVANFDWGNPFVTNFVVDNSTWNTTYGAARTITNVTISESSSLNTVGQIGGIIARLRLVGNSTINASNSNVSLINFEAKQASTIKLSAFTAGSTLSSYSLSASSINFSNSTSAVSLSNVTLVGSTINHTNVTSGTLAGFNVSLDNGSIVNHNTGAGTLTMTRVAFVNQGAIHHSTGTASITDSIFDRNASLTQNISAGVINFNSVLLTGNSTVTNQAVFSITLTRTKLDASSTIAVAAGAGGVLSATGLTSEHSGTINITAGSTAGNITLNNVKFASNGLIQKSGTGVINATHLTLSDQGRILSSGTRGLSFTRVNASELSTIQSTNATSVATDAMTDVRLTTRASVNFSASGAAANSVLYTTIEGAAAALNISGTNTGGVIQRANCNGGTITFANNTVAATVDIADINNTSHLMLQNMTVSKTISYVTANNQSSVTILNPTGVGNHTLLQAENFSNITINGTAASSAYLHARNRGSITQNGGAVTGMIKEMTGAITTGNFTHSHVFMCSPVSITLTAANNSRATYLGVTSTVPLF